jgi:glycosyltransferase involved in cell wall biosynthesis
MRTLHIVGTISPAAGGPTEVIRMLVRYAPPGYTSELVTLDDPSAGFLAEIPCPVHAMGGAEKAWYSPKLIAWLRANADRFDGVIVHGLWEFTGLAVRWTLAGRIPYAVFPHGMLDPYFKRRHPAKHLKKWIYWIGAEYWVLRGADRVLFTTTTERDLAQHSFWPARWKSAVVALGTEPPPEQASQLLDAFRARVPEVFVTPTRPERFLLFLGRIDRKKGCDLLLKAFADVVHADPALRLVMAGPDPTGWRTELNTIAQAKGVADRVHWPGILLGDAKWGALAACEAFVLPSHQENFGIAVVEALASGKPVLISEQVNIAPEVAADRCGLVGADTLAGTRTMLDQWLAMSLAERAAMGQQALRSFAERYDMRRNAAAILRVFETKSPSPHPTATGPRPQNSGASSDRDRKEVR